MIGSFLKEEELKEVVMGMKDGQSIDTWEEGVVKERRLYVIHVLEAENKQTPPRTALPTWGWKCLLCGNSATVVIMYYDSQIIL